MNKRTAKFMPATKPTTKSSALKRNRSSARRKSELPLSGIQVGLKKSRSLKLRTILVPVDFSEYSRAALDYAVKVARDSGASLVILHVLDPLLVTRRLESSQLRRLKEASRSNALEQLSGLSRSLDRSGVRTKAVLRNGPATDIIVAFALTVKGDLIIMGSQGRTGLRRLLIGSVAERVVRHAPCPVLVVR